MAEKKPSQRHVAALRSHGDRSQPRPTAEQEWQALLVAQDDDTFIADIVAELMECVMDACLRAFITRECVSYTVRWARDVILRSVLWRFLMRDEGDTDPGIDTEDEEPQPCPLDSCAHGCVPVRPSRSKVSSASVGAQDSPVVAKAGGPPLQPPCPSRVPTATTTIPALEPSRLEDNAVIVKRHKERQ